MALSQEEMAAAIKELHEAAIAVVCEAIDFPSGSSPHTHRITREQYNRLRSAVVHMDTCRRTFEADGGEGWTKKEYKEHKEPEEDTCPYCGFPKNSSTCQKQHP